MKRSSLFLNELFEGFRSRLPQWVIVLLAATACALLIWGLAHATSPVSESTRDRLRAGGALGTFLMVVASPRLANANLRVRRILVAGIAALMLLCAVATVESSLGKHLGRAKQVSTWNFFHYYLGSKYFAELGYDGLYPEMLKADQQSKRRFEQASHYRQMETYEVVSAETVRHQPRSETWSDERWDAFKDDVATIGRFKGKRFWSMPLMDRGYNAPPGWMNLGGLLSRHLDPSRPFQTAVMMLFDPLLVLLAFWYSVRVYGWWRSWLVLAGAITWIGSHRLFGGKLLQYDWFAACWVALACMKQQRWVAAGALFAFATSVRIFPGVFMIPPLLQALGCLVRTRTIPRHLLRLLGSGAATLVVLVVVSSATCGRGFKGWIEFADAIETHNHHHKFSDGRIGLPFLTTASLESGIQETVPQHRREAAYEENQELRVVLQLLMFGLAVAGALREDTHDAAPLGLVILFAFAVSSRYYGVVYVLLLLRHVHDFSPRRALPHRPPRLGYAMDVAFFLLTALLFIPELMGEERRVVYMIASAGLLLYLSSEAMASALRRRRTSAPGVRGVPSENAVGT